jgi:uncharacterized protein
MTDTPARPPLDWSGNAPFPFTRESSIRLDVEGHFWHEGARVDHPKLATAMASWISKHPTDGRWVLENGYDWCYLTIEDVPLWVRSARIDGDVIVSTLSDGSEERIDPRSLTVDETGALRCVVKRASRGGPYPAKFARHAQLAMGERLRERGREVILAIDGQELVVPSS